MLITHIIVGSIIQSASSWKELKSRIKMQGQSHNAKDDYSVAVESEIEEISEETDTGNVSSCCESSKKEK